MQNDRIISSFVVPFFYHKSVVNSSDMIITSPSPSSSQSSPTEIILEDPPVPPSVTDARPHASFTPSSPETEVFINASKAPDSYTQSPVSVSDPPSTDSDLQLPMSSEQLSTDASIVSLAVIPSLGGGDAEDSVSPPPLPTYAEAVKLNAETPEVIIIGTSMTEGLGSELLKIGTAATNFKYSGATIQRLIERVPYILPKEKYFNKDPIIFTQCGGNDSSNGSTASSIINLHSDLVATIK